MPDTKASLLIVDDDASIRLSLCRLLKEIGYRVRVAEDGHSALTKINEELPDILVSDLQMPGMSGFELLAFVREQFSGLRTVAMSGGFHRGEIPAVVADAFYRKGSGLELLLETIESLPRG